LSFWLSDERGGFRADSNARGGPSAESFSWRHDGGDQAFEPRRTLSRYLWTQGLSAVEGDRTFGKGFASTGRSSRPSDGTRRRRSGAFVSQPTPFCFRAESCGEHRRESSGCIKIVELGRARSAAVGENGARVCRKTESRLRCSR